MLGCSCVGEVDQTPTRTSAVTFSQAPLECQFKVKSVFFLLSGPRGPREPHVRGDGRQVRRGDRLHAAEQQRRLPRHRHPQRGRRQDGGGEDQGRQGFMATSRTVFVDHEFCDVL